MSGAVFWMWVTALLGGASALVESTLAQIYKKKDAEGGSYGAEEGRQESDFQGCRCRCDRAYRFLELSRCEKRASLTVRGAFFEYWEMQDRRKGAVKKA